MNKFLNIMRAIRNQRKELIQQLRLQNQKLQNFAQSALNRLEFYENGSNLGQLTIEEVHSLEETLNSNLNKLNEEKNKRKSFSKIKQNSSEENLKQISSSDFQKEMEVFKEKVPLPEQVKNQKPAWQSNGQNKKPITKPQIATTPKLSKRQQASPNSKIRQSLKEAKEYISERRDLKDLKQNMTAKTRARSSEEKKDNEEFQLHNDIQSLASRLFNLTEKFTQRKQGQPKVQGSPAKQPQWKKDNKWVLQWKDSNNEDIIFETDSEFGRDSKSSINETNRQKKGI